MTDGLSVLEKIGEESFQFVFKSWRLFLTLFRAIFDLSNKIALLILLRMYALYVKKKQKFEQKFKNWLKSDIFSSF